ncbi:MAG TPA: sugar ABC transporter ATP-binding protein [Ilumatobacteraceae bacterium]
MTATGSTEIGSTAIADTGGLNMTTDTTDAPSVLSVRGVSKRYGPVKANDDISIEFRAGEIHALLGENGSGKSTLLGIASGTVVPDAGEVEIAGRPLTSASPKAAMDLGLGMAYQTMSEVAGLTVAQNLYLAAPADVRPRWSNMEAWAAARLRDASLDINATAKTESLSMAQRQMLEVVQALLSDPKVLLLDEPTTALGHADVDRLHILIRDLAARGIGIVYVSHRLPEVLDVASRVTVLRDGVNQGSYDAAEMTEADVVALMIGRPLEMAFPESLATPSTDVVLKVSRLRGRRFGPVDLTLNRGEIVGIAGAEGNGQVQFLRALAGVEPSNGSVLCANRKVDLTNPPGPIRAGLVMLSADRKAESVFTALGVRANATLQVLRRFGRFGYVRRKRERQPVEQLVDRLRLKAASIEQPAQYLSGGNQQKVALLRPFLSGNLHVILADEPTQGVDVGARIDIYQALRAKAEEGTAVLVKSSDAIELAGLCDRVVVMSRGQIVDEIPKHELGERRIIAAIIGQASRHGGIIE